MSMWADKNHLKITKSKQKRMSKDELQKSENYQIDNEDDDNERHLVRLFDFHSDINGGNK